jgi:hypothetical protein
MVLLPPRPADSMAARPCDTLRSTQAGRPLQQMYWRSSTIWPRTRHDLGVEPIMWSTISRTSDVRPNSRAVVEENLRGHPGGRPRPGRRRGAWRRSATRSSAYVSSASAVAAQKMQTATYDRRRGNTSTSTAADSCTLVRRTARRGTQLRCWRTVVPSFSQQAANRCFALRRGRMTSSRASAEVSGSCRFKMIGGGRARSGL